MTQQSIPLYDVVIIGGGINGVGTALDAAGRGMRVCLIEQQDLAYGTSSGSSKLIHGGLRYLENFEFAMVKESLQERAYLLKNAPHLVRPLAFIIPVNPKIRSGFIIGLGLWLYDLFSGKKRIAKCSTIDLTEKKPNPLNLTIKKAYQYYDCQTDDARLVVTLAKAAKQKGAQILTYTRCAKVNKIKKNWEIILQDESANISTIHAKAIVNATGPWAADFAKNVLHANSHFNLALVKGSHIVVQKMYEGNEAYVLQNSDRRIIFVIPYLTHYTLIGTTDVKLKSGNPDEAEVTLEEKNYLIESVNNYFHNSLELDDILWSYWGVRALVQDKNSTLSQITRDYKIELLNENSQHIIVNIFGGKLTSFRKLAEEVTNKLQTFIPSAGKIWTNQHILPGGELNTKNLDEFIHNLEQQYSFLTSSMLHRLAYSYGTETYKILDSVTTLSELGELFGADLYECEVKYLVENEWVKHLDDLIWRRSKFGLKLSNAQKEKLKSKILRWK